MTRSHGLFTGCDWDRISIQDASNTTTSCSKPNLNNRRIPFILRHRFLGLHTLTDLVHRFRSCFVTMPSKEQPSPCAYKRQQPSNNAARRISRDILLVRRCVHVPPEEGNRGKNTSKCACGSVTPLYRALRRQTEQHTPEDGFDKVEDHVCLQGAPAS